MRLLPSRMNVWLVVAVISVVGRGARANFRLSDHQEEDGRRHDRARALSKRPRGRLTLSEGPRGTPLMWYGETR